MKGRRFTQDQIKEFFKANECQVLNIEDYKDIYSKLNFRCQCGNIKQTTFNVFKLYPRCNECGGKAHAATIHKKKTKEILEFAEQNGFKILEPYIERSTPIVFECQCGQTDKRLWNNLKQYPYCKKCARESITGKNHYSFYDNRELKDKIRETHTISQKHLNKYKLALKFNRKPSDIVLEPLKYSVKQFIDKMKVDLGNKTMDFKTMNIDHIFPISAFVRHNIFDLNIINHLDNLRPVSKFENLSKHSKYDKTEFYAWLDSIGYTNYTKQLEDNQNGKNV